MLTRSSWSRRTWKLRLPSPRILLCCVAFAVAHARGGAVVGLRFGYNGGAVCPTSCVTFLPACKLF